MKRISAAVLSLAVIVTLFAQNVFAAELTVEQTNMQIAEMRDELEEKYYIDIDYKIASNGRATVTLNSLTTLDKALNEATPELVRQVSNYYNGLNGRRLRFSYVKSSAVINERDETVLAGFDDTRSLIELYLPSSNDAAMITGESPINILHEFAHAAHIMFMQHYGEKRMREEWTSFNAGQRYDAENIVKNPDDKIFVSGYAATSFHEDVAETLAHALVRNRNGQGMSAKLYSNGQWTGLGKKVRYIESMLEKGFANTAQVLKNYKRVYEATGAVTYQNMRFSGDYLQYIGYPQPRYVLNGTLNRLNKKLESAIWMTDLGGWYVRERGGNEIIVFPGGVWCETPGSFVAPKAA